MININNLVIENTRCCNMECLHCLRGNIEMRVINEDVVRSTNEKLNIYELTITGGEPLSNYRGLHLIADWLQYKVLYIKINSSIFSKNVAKALKRLFYNVYEKSTIYISIDEFHSNAIKTNEIVNFCENNDINLYINKTNYNNHKSIINIGRALESGIGNNKYKLDKIDIENNLIDLLYITYNGDIYSDCNLSYEVMREYKDLICLGNIVTDTTENILSNIYAFNDKCKYEEFNNIFNN